MKILVEWLKMSDYIQKRDTDIHKKKKNTRIAKLIVSSLRSEFNTFLFGKYLNLEIR